METKEACNCGKKTHRGEEERKIIANRISRIEGQLKGIRRMVQEDAYCNDVLVQLSAVEHSVKSLANHILENHLYSCVSRDLENGKLEVIDELIALFKKFNKA
ncbi:MAG: metal-sensing transcriptional repressor [Peptococcaceae bacterium]|nr:metal-sensing transcriptional repressor [Peptococcaceae bacterium]